MVERQLYHKIYDAKRAKIKITCSCGKQDKGLSHKRSHERSHFHRDYLLKQTGIEKKYKWT